MEKFKKLIFLLSYQDRKYLVILMIMTTLMALIDVIGIASILPFVAVLTNQELIETNTILKYMFEISSTFKVETKIEFIFLLGIIVLLLMVFSLTVKSFTIYLKAQFVYLIEYSIGKKLFEGYLHQPYSWFLNHHSADIGKNILSEVSIVISYGLNPLIELFSKIIVTVTLIILLLFINLKLTLIIALSFGYVYLMIFYFGRKYLNHIGSENIKNNELRFKSVSEAFEVIKEIKFKKLEKIYLKIFNNSAKKFAENQARVEALNQLPRYLIELIAFGSILLVIIFNLDKSENFTTYLPILSLYVFAGYRLLPAFQQIYGSFTHLAFVGPALNQLYRDLDNFKPFHESKNKDVLIFEKEITLKNVNYNYPDTSRTALKNINLSIPSKSSVGIVGPTGSGKTTLVDIILRLLEPQTGAMEVDGKIISEENKRTWQKSLGYVPQKIHLIDDTIEANIAFGVEFKNIKKDVVEIVSKIANLHEFVTEELPNKYQTKIGENGIRLSGGQIQRIGIARALYHNPKVLILDEATSALDNDTEKLVMDALNNLSKDLTLIIIAHRLNTIKNCDIIFKLDKGQLTKQ